MSDRPPSTIHHTELPEGDPSDREYQTYRREVARLLAEGHDGRWALIKGDEVFGVFDTLDEARAEGTRRFLLSSFLLRHVHDWEPVRPFPNYWM